MEKIAIKEARDELLKPDLVTNIQSESINQDQEAIDKKFNEGGETYDDKMVEILDQTNHDLTEKYNGVETHSLQKKVDVVEQVAQSVQVNLHDEVDGTDPSSQKSLNE